MKAIDPFAQLRLRHRVALWQRPVWFLAASLGLDLVLALAGTALETRAWVFGVVLAAGLTMSLLTRPSLRGTARALDRKAGTHNRLEALAELGGRTDALAKAIAEESAVHLAHRPLPRPYPWFAAIATVAVLAVLQVAMLGVAEQRRLARIAANQPPAQAPGPAEVLPPTPMPPAALRWLEPSAGITATAAEIVRLLAQPDCSVALKDLNLHITLGGEPIAPLPQTAGAEADAPVSLALDLSTLNCRPYTFVTYHLSAERTRAHVSPGTPSWPRVFSPLQLIQIRPVGSDLALEPPPADLAAENETERLLFQVRRLKLAHMETVRSIFALGHEQPPRDDTQWPQWVEAAAGQERALWQDLGSIEATNEPHAADALPLLRLARIEVQAAWDELARRAPEAAFAPADRALTAIGEAEGVLAARVAQLRDAHLLAAKTEEAVDPTVGTPPTLPARGQTPAGRLEELSRRQRALAGELVGGRWSDFFNRQDQIARALPPLASEKGFPAEIASAIASAASDAGEAARHLNERDVRAATEPATRAAQTLQDAVDALDAIARAAAVHQLAAAQRTLNRAALAVNDGDVDVAIREVDAIRRELHREAVRQQQLGSEAAARQLATTCTKMDESQVRSDLGTLQKSPSPGECTACARKLTGLAQQAATARQQLQSPEERAEELRKASEELRRAQANAGRAAEQGAQEMQDLYEKAQERAQQAGESLDMPPPSSDRPADKDAAESGATCVADTIRELRNEQASVLSVASSLVATSPPRTEEERHAAIESITEQEHSIRRTTESLLPQLEDEPTAHDAAAEFRLASKEVRSACDTLERSDVAAACAPARRALAHFTEVLRLLPASACACQKCSGKQESSQPSTGSSPPKSPGQPTNGLESSLGRQTPGSLADPVNRTRYARDLSAQIERVVRQVEAEHTRLVRTTVLTTSDPAEAPPAYRPAVAGYFESLARSAAESRPAPAPPTP